MDYQIKPNIRKVMIIHLITMMAIWVAAIFAIAGLSKMLGDVGMAFEFLNIKLPSRTQAYAVLIGIGVFATIFWSALRYTKYGGSYWALDENQLSVTQRVGLEKKRLQVGLEQVSRVYYSDDSALNKIVGCKMIGIETSGTELQKIELEYVDKAVEWVNYIQQLVNKKKALSGMFVNQNIT